MTASVLRTLHGSMPAPVEGRPAEPISDAELVAEVRAGEAWAFEALYRRYAPQVLRTTTRILARKSDAEDVTHDAFATALACIGDLETPSAFRPWLMRSAVRAARWKLRRRAFGRVLGIEPGPLDASLDLLAAHEAEPDVRVELSELGRRLERVPTDHRIAWVLRVVEGHSLAEVTEYMGASLATVKRWIARTDAAVTGEQR
jgi:RNA polymerase sigma-70 factor (ECF subfamily)